jgi:hypothetical protein
MKRFVLTKLQDQPGLKLFSWTPLSPTYVSSSVNAHTSYSSFHLLFADPVAIILLEP